jgi:hypothetical protein
LLGACLSVAACADPEAQDVDFDERNGVVHGAGSSVQVAEHFDWSGHYLLALSTVLAPDHPLLFAVDSKVADDLALVDLRVQALTTDADGEPRTHAGDPFDLNDVRYSEDGTFEVDLGDVAVLGRANPITGSDITAQVQLRGSTYRAAEDVPQHFCGDVNGRVSQPIPLDLERSTFGAVLTEDEKQAEPMLRCP